MRGAHGQSVEPYTQEGIIPAYAGSTLAHRIVYAGIRDHPRVCGEHAGSGFLSAIGSGSSPRMRGARHRVPVEALQEGIIPAYAGSTACPRSNWGRGWDHPRVCGEHLSASSGYAPQMGSSPRMRGARIGKYRDAVSTRIIPAYAGSTRQAGTEAAESRDHPRVCGEHSVRLVPCNRPPGSSPRMRGALFASCLNPCGFGIIPAYAGSTRRGARRRSPGWDHPRVCGEHSMAANFSLTLAGSSPRMRGAPLAGLLVLRSVGIIPAYAGSTRNRRRP